MQRIALFFGFCALPLRAIVELIAKLLKSEADLYHCAHCEAENALQLALARVRRNYSLLDEALIHLRLEQNAVPARVFLSHNTVLTDLSLYLESIRQKELMSMGHFVLNFHRVEHVLLHLLDVQYHDWIRHGCRDRLADVLQEHPGLYQRVLSLHPDVSIRTDVLHTLCSELKDHMESTSETATLPQLATG